MPALKFNPYHSLVAYATNEEKNIIPLERDNLIFAKFNFGSPMFVTESRRTSEDLKGITAKWETLLVPFGNFLGHTIESRVQRASDREEYTLQFLAVEDDYLQGILTAEDIDAFPFLAGHLVCVPLMIYQIKLSEGNQDGDWEATLIPFGDWIDGLIITKVEPADP